MNFAAAFESYSRATQEVVRTKKNFEIAVAYLNQVDSLISAVKRGRSISQIEVQIDQLSTQLSDVALAADRFFESVDAALDVIDGTVSNIETGLETDFADDPVFESIRSHKKQIAE